MHQAQLGQLTWPSIRPARASRQDRPRWQSELARAGLRLAAASWLSLATLATCLANPTTVHNMTAQNGKFPARLAIFNYQLS